MSKTTDEEIKKILKDIEKLIEEEYLKQKYLKDTEKTIDFLLKLISEEEEKIKEKKKLEEEKKKKEEENKKIEEEKKKKREDKLNFMKYLIKIRDSYKNKIPFAFQNTDTIEDFDQYSNYTLNKIESEIKRLKKQIKLLDIVLQIKNRKKKISI